MTFRCRRCELDCPETERRYRQGEPLQTCGKCLDERAGRRREAKAAGLRWCCICGESKPPGEFSPISRKALSSYCRPCAARRTRERKRLEREAATRRRCTRCKRMKPVGEITAYSREYRCADCEAARAAMGKWTHRSRHAAAKYVAKRRGFAFTLTLDEFIALRKKPCRYCGWPLPENGGLDRIDPHGGYTKGNVLPCCTECNIARGCLFTSEEMLVLGRAIAEVKAARAAAGVTAPPRTGWGRPKKCGNTLDSLGGHGTHHQ